MRSQLADARLSDEAFADFANQSDLPNFGYIGLHNIWSWIPDVNRAVISTSSAANWKSAVLYVRYNTQPGFPPSCQPWLPAIISRYYFVLKGIFKFS